MITRSYFTGSGQGAPPRQPLENHQKTIGALFVPGVSLALTDHIITIDNAKMTILIYGLSLDRLNRGFNSVLLDARYAA